MGMVVSFTRVTEADLARMTGRPEAAWDLLNDMKHDEREPSGYIDKAWGGLEYLFERARIGVDLFFDGAEIDDDGHLTAWSPDLVGATAATLSATRFETLAEYFDASDMDDSQVYPTVWTRDGDDVGLMYLRGNYEELVAFFAHAAKFGSGAVMSFS